MEGNQINPVHAIQTVSHNGVLPNGAFAHEYYDDDEEMETAGSLTKQLAETAVGVREMSKQLGTSAQFDLHGIS